MRVAMVFPGLPRRPGGAFLAAISQARAIGLYHDLHTIVLGEREEARSRICAVRSPARFIVYVALVGLSARTSVSSCRTFAPM